MFGLLAEQETNRTFTNIKTRFLFKFLVLSLHRFNIAHNVPPLLVSCEVRNFIFSVKDKNSCET